MIEIKKYYLSENISLPSLAFAKRTTVVTPFIRFVGRSETKTANYLWEPFMTLQVGEYELQTCKILMSVLNEKQIIFGIIQVGLTRSI